MAFEIKSSASLQGALLWPLACTLVLGSLLVSRAVVSSPFNPLSASAELQTLAMRVVDSLEPEPEAAAARDKRNGGGGVTTIITHSHNRILESFPPGQYEWQGNAGLSLARSLLDAPAEVGYVRKTYTHHLPAQDGKDRTLRLSTTTPMIEFRHVGFPQIETHQKRTPPRYKLYRPAMHVRVQKDGSRDIVANIRCHGYSPHRTHKLATRYETHINDYATQYRVDKHLVKAIIAQESCFRNHAVSPVGAVGLMQLMPATAKWLGVKEYTVARQNLQAGVRYLAQLIKQFGSSELALAAYNAGPGNVRKYNGVPPFPETRDYIERVMTNYHSYTLTESFKSSRL